MRFSNLILITLLSLHGKIGESSIIREMKYPVLKQLFNEQATRIASVADFYQPTDPFALYSQYQRAEMCEELITARTYHVLSYNMSFPPLQRMPPPSAPNFQNMDYGEDMLGYNQYPIELQQPDDTVNAFICQRTSDFEWYLTYGHNLADSFVLKKDNNGSYLQVSAVLEPTPIIDDYLYGPSDQANVETLFRKRISSAPGFQSPICSLTNVQQFFLCTAVHDALVVIRNRTQVKHYYVKPYENACTTTAIEFTTGSSSSQLYADILPCAIHQEWNHPSFYVTADPTENSSVFVIDSERTVLAHVRNIKPPMIRDAIYF